MPDETKTNEREIAGIGKDDEGAVRDHELNRGYLDTRSEISVLEASADQLTDKTAVQYTSHPIANYKLGRFQFSNGVLSLTKDSDVEEFEKLLNDDNLPTIERNRVKKIDLARAEQIVKDRLAAQRQISQVTDSSIGDPHRNTPKVGKGDLLAGDTGAVGMTNLADADSLPPAVGQGSEGETSSTQTADAPVLVTGTGVTDPNHAGTNAGGTGDATSGENQGFAHGNPAESGVNRDQPTAPDAKPTAEPAKSGIAALGAKK